MSEYKDKYNNLKDLMVKLTLNIKQLETESSVTDYIRINKELDEEELDEEELDNDEIDEEELDEDELDEEELYDDELDDPTNNGIKNNVSNGAKL